MTWQAAWYEAARIELSERIDEEGNPALTPAQVEQAIQRAIRESQSWRAPRTVHEAVTRAIAKAVPIYLPDEKPHFPEDGMCEWLYWQHGYYLRSYRTLDGHLPESNSWCIARLNVNNNQLLTTIARLGCTWQGVAPWRVFGYTAAERYGGAVPSSIGVENPHRLLPQRDNGSPWSRFVIWQFCHTYTGLSYDEIGELFGVVWGSTVRQALSPSGRQRKPLCWTKMMADLDSLLDREMEDLGAPLP